VAVLRAGGGLSATARATIAAKTAIPGLFEVAAAPRSCAGLSEAVSTPKGQVSLSEVVVVASLVAISAAKLGQSERVRVVWARLQASYRSELPVYPIG